MLNLRIISVVALLCSSIFCFAQQPIRLIVQQNQGAISQKKLPKAKRLKEFINDSNTVVSELTALINALHQLGYAEAAIDSISWKKDTTIAQLYVGERYFFSHIEDGNVPKDVLRKVGFREQLFSGEELRPARLTRLKKRLTQFYENRGFPFAQVSLEELKLDSNQLSAVLNLNKGREFRIDSIIIKGSARIKSKYLQNYLGIKSTDRYNESRIAPISTRIKEIAFVTEIKPAEVVFNKDKADLYLYLDKKRASQFDGILGILPNTDTPGNVLITGELNIKLLSAFRSGELIDISWRKIQARTQNLNMQFTYPFLFNTAFGLDGTFELYKRDTLYLNLRGVIGVQYLLLGNDYFKVFADLRTTNVLAPSVLTATATLNPDNVDSRMQLYGFGYKMQRLDYRLNPRKGFDLYAEASAGTKKIVPDATVEEIRYEGLKRNSFQMNATLKAAYFIPIPNRSTFRIAFNGGYMRSENLFESEAFRIGGLKSLRGSDEESIYATLFGIATIEYRFLLDRNSFLVAFFDGAYYENRATNKRITDRPFGFGLGISFATKIGIFSLNYALGKQFNNPIDFRNGKIHFGMVNFF